MEFAGSALQHLSMEERQTLCNMAIEAGGKNGIIPADEITKAYVDARNAGNKPYEVRKIRVYDHRGIMCRIFVKCGMRRRHMKVGL